jgi:glyoxylase-like metal-dependent hydrolase (beta-lactamase superfamily II)
LHFDHAGGLLSPWQANSPYQLLFSNAQYVVSAAAWQRALQPHPRDRASFINELTHLLQQSKRLLLIDGESCPQLGADYRFFISHGHTPGMLHTIIQMPQGPIVFAADLIPGIPWLHLPVTMGYDRFPELVIDEKQQLLTHMLQQNGRVFYTHDLNHAMSNVAVDSKGRYIATNAVAHVTHLVE